MNELLFRVAAAQATLDHWRDQPFKWGTVDCVRMMAWHLRRMGHRVKLPPSGSYSSALTAARRLRERGHDDVIAAVDALGFDRIAPAAALPGDVLGWPKDDGIGIIAIRLSNGRVVGFHDDTVGATVLQPLDVACVAWRTPPATAALEKAK